MTLEGYRWNSSDWLADHSLPYLDMLRVKGSSSRPEAKSTSDGFQSMPSTLRNSRWSAARNPSLNYESFVMRRFMLADDGRWHALTEERRFDDPILSDSTGGNPTVPAAIDFIVRSAERNAIGLTTVLNELAVLVVTAALSNTTMMAKFQLLCFAMAPLLIAAASVPKTSERRPSLFDNLLRLSGDQNYKVIQGGANGVIASSIGEGDRGEVTRAVSAISTPCAGSGGQTWWLAVA
ncbi:unnamed protein product [Soboliphyme baturini]|uniref:ABC transmembrane type-1 domain-containing protein n=1 Tax=Soboliphyme baturini TaxID=241478 RepID=A0A183IV54_9BILA|nr:unnamed protein product [Soboliphyme baturini]